jgi:hypothetical protein
VQLISSTLPAIMMHLRGMKAFSSYCSSGLKIPCRFSSGPPRISLSNVHQTISGRPRFYKTVDVVSVTNYANIEMFKILLDGRTLRTPAGNDLHLPNIEIALSIASEWDAQRAKNPKGIQPATMPLMTLAATAIDQILPDAYLVKKTCLSYLPTDTALFLTSESDRLLLKKQRQHFQPISRWLKKSFDVDLKTTHDMSGRISHPEETSRKVELIFRIRIRVRVSYIFTCLFQSCTYSRHIRHSTCSIYSLILIKEQPTLGRMDGGSFRSLLFSMSAECYNGM